MRRLKPAKEAPDPLFAFLDDFELVTRLPGATERADSVYRVFAGSKYAVPELSAEKFRERLEAIGFRFQQLTKNATIIHGMRLRKRVAA